MTPLWHAIAVALLLASTTAAGAGASGAAAGELQVYAAVSLTDVLQELAVRYEKAGGDHIVLNLGASNVLARQIAAGAPADLFGSADEAKMDELAKRRLLLPGTRRDLLSNSLVVVVPVGSALAIASPGDLTGPAVHAIALGDPEAVPAGIYAKSYLQQKGIWEKLSGRLIPTESVRAALAAVEAENADAGIVYKTDARISKKVRVAYEVPRAEGPPIAYPFAVVAGTKRPAAARRFLAFLASPAAAALFERYGFLPLAR